MIKQLISKDIKNYIAKNPNCVLLDVRTQKEWDTIGRPDGEKIGLKTYFLEIRRDAFFDFVKEFKNLNIKQDNEVLVICASGERSQITAELLSRENYKSINISDGFMGSQEGVGWRNNGLPC
tara:strand:- start:727 stop:1092 length:366 start_codon:yes stop_codon:yes gene_type:complete